MKFNRRAFLLGGAALAVAKPIAPTIDPAMLPIENANYLPCAAGEISLAPSSVPFSDLFLVGSRVINFANGDVTIVHELSDKQPRPA